MRVDKREFLPELNSLKEKNDDEKTSCNNPCKTEKNTKKAQVFPTRVISTMFGVGRKKRSWLKLPLIRRKCVVINFKCKHKTKLLNEKNIFII